MNKVMVCRDCGSDEVTYDTSVRWDVGAQRWQALNDMWSPWCDDCKEAEIVAKDTSRKSSMTPERIAEQLRDGARADIWYDYATFDDDGSLEKFITDVQLAMQLAANIIDPK